MDKQLILRLAREAGISETRLHFDELDDLCDFATLVAEECAKIAERHQLADTTCGISMSVPASPFHAAMIRKAFKASEVLDWRTEALNNVRTTEKRLRSPGGYALCRAIGIAVKKHAGAQPTQITFEMDWLRNASDEDILRAIDASEAPAFHSPPATVVPNTVPYWPRQMATRPRDPDEKG
jgi:hypothetical protein